MRIEETCSCGARVVIDCRIPVAAQEAIIAWRRDHRHIADSERSADRPTEGETR